MKRHSLATVFLAAVATMAAFTSADLLKVGDPAPALTVGKWVKGEPVKEFEKGKIYVVEFWATWCGPCKATIPHLSEMAKANPEVTFIGANVWERDETLVEPFVKEMGDKMGYSVVMDDKSKDEKGAMATTWMEAAGRNGIPAAFLVNKEGVVAWIGHPMQLDDVLKDVVAGEYNLDDAKAAADDEAKQRENEMALSKEFEEKVMPALDKQDWDAAVKALDEMAAAHPESKEAITGAKFNILVQAGKFDLAYAAADQIAEINDKNAEKLNELAWFIVDNEAVATRDLDRAAKYAARAVELTDSKNGAVLDTLARVHFEKGEVEKAVELQTKAMEVASDGEREELAKSLEKYKAALPK